MKISISLLFFLFILGDYSAQIDSAEVYRQLFGDEEEFISTEKENEEAPISEPILVDDDEVEEESKGIPIFISLQPAVYFANNANANFYNGSIEEIAYEDRLVIQTIWDNPNNKRVIKDDLDLTDYEYDQVFFDQSNFNYNMTYDIGFMIGFQVFFALKKRFHILLDFNFVSLNTASLITLFIEDLNTPNDLTKTMEVFGKEQRFIMDLGVHWVLGNGGLKYYVEGGTNFLMAKATDNFFKTSDVHTWQLRRTNNNNVAANTITSFTFGGFFGAGLYFQMNENFAFEFGPQVSVNNIKFPGYAGYFTNYQINLRIMYLSKNSAM
jgi:hypothetical protein